MTMAFCEDEEFHEAVNGDGGSKHIGDFTGVGEDGRGCVVSQHSASDGARDPLSGRWALRHERLSTSTIAGCLVS